jgi:inward rectifier potassium channel
MWKPTFDPGLTQQYAGSLRRMINKDGSFNVVRRGAGWRDIHPYLHLINASWTVFFTVIISAYAVVNMMFAAVYYLLGPDTLSGGFEAPTSTGRFLTSLYFSSHTLTTVGFGNIAPKSDAANLIAAFEAFIGLLGFAIATGLLFGRVSKPSARIGFSERAIIAPYHGGSSLQFRVVNRRPNTLLELEAMVLLSAVNPLAGKGPTRTYTTLQLEREKVYFFPLTWTVVHPIGEDSPLYGKSSADLEAMQAELLILIKAWDDTFSQTVNQRYSYRYDEIVWNARFAPAFETSRDGNMIVRIDRVGHYDPA